MWSVYLSNPVTLIYYDVSGRYSSLVKSYSTRINNTAAWTFNYTYDSNGNITRITDNYNAVTQYQYDDLGQLIREDNPYLNKSYVYEYDKNGNRTVQKTYAYTTGTLGAVTVAIPYTYGDSTWGDRLTLYKGHTITYDEIGNPLTYFVNGSTYNYTWSDGRRLTSATKGSNTYSFTYNDEGIRTSKTVNGVKHTYLLEGSRIISEQWGNHHIVYVYDETGAPVGMYYRTNSYAEGTFDVFYFEKNLQGDIIGVYNSSGVGLVGYTYDAWGNCTAQYYSNGSSSPARYNPFRYRGYYYDTDLGLYYLNSRYYDANTGRFINADEQLNGAILGYNTFAYCHNNPISGYDPCGYCFHKWDFWNDCDDCGGRSFVEQLSAEWEAFVETLEVLSEAIYFDFSFGTGVGGSVEAYDVEVTCLVAREDAFTIKKEAGSSIVTGKTIQQQFGFSANGCDMSTGYTTFIDNNNQSITEPINPNFNLKKGVSIKAYAIIGITIEFGVDVEYLIDYFY